MGSVARPPALGTTLRIAVLGNTAGGKTTFSHRLGAALAIPCHSVDEIRWRAGWKKCPVPEVMDLLGEWVAQTQWIIDGNGPFECTRLTLRSADYVVYVDLPLTIHYWQLLKRSVRYWSDAAPGHAAGCPGRLFALRMARGLWRMHFGGRKKLDVALLGLGSTKPVFRVRRRSELGRLLDDPPFHPVSSRRHEAVRAGRASMPPNARD